MCGEHGGISLHVLPNEGIIPACAGNTQSSSVIPSASGDHPRVCGEHAPSRLQRRPRWGSSPRVRGTPQAGRRRTRSRGIIPACAGNTSRRVALYYIENDHPRVCGEHLARPAAGKVAVGSSPRVRGTHRIHRLLVGPSGIIPACAGNTQRHRHRLIGRRDHPRVCGEHAVEKPTAKDRMGSSPRVRGTRRVRQRQCATVGIIPACAGNTICVDSTGCLRRDHPRVCGEHPRHDTRKRHVAGSSPRVRGTPCFRAPFRGRRGDHPRVCGEHHRSFARSSVSMGSSPRVRGTLGKCGHFAHKRGIIPACAGNTRQATWNTWPARDHPRVCGEHDEPAAIQAVLLGSSPRVRGTQLLVGYRVPEEGIIPACAGNTGLKRMKASASRDHPRVCGEHDGRDVLQNRRKGSSPRVRGTHVHERCVRQFGGIIPACAGNTISDNASGRRTRDHPRVCGEHPVHRRGILFFRGSSPRVRGTQQTIGHDHHHARIIPACAGNTWFSGMCISGGGDHPRVCGEHVGGDAEHGGGLGSSPRVRGTPEHFAGGHYRERIIPACAGNTTSSRMTIRPVGDHPRVCGEHDDGHLGHRPVEGSSPRVRGTRRGGQRHQEGTGIIPTCAGNTEPTWNSIGKKRDHPRVCGEHRVVWGLDQLSQGSSPRVRGTLSFSECV